MTSRDVRDRPNRTDANDQYYATVFGFAFPVTTGHYSLTLDRGVFVQAQVAP